MEFTPITNPISAFETWLKEARAHSGIRDADAMAVATVNAKGEIHNRVVLCKDWSEDGFTFYTNYKSEKGQDLAANPRAGAVFFWDPLHRQVRISGAVTQTNRQVSEAYWRSRPFESQLSQYISRQSETVGSREDLEKAWSEAEAKFNGREIPCPEHWGGYVIRPERMEFWVGQPNRLHDRYVYEKIRSHWTFRRLYP